jgi:hypothetical protein
VLRRQDKSQGCPGLTEWHATGQERRLEILAHKTPLPWGPNEGHGNCSTGSPVVLKEVIMGVGGVSLGKSGVSGLHIHGEHMGPAGAEGPAQMLRNL